MGGAARYTAGSQRALDLWRLHFLDFFFFLQSLAKIILNLFVVLNKLVVFLQFLSFL